MSSFIKENEREIILFFADLPCLDFLDFLYNFTLSFFDGALLLDGTTFLEGLFFLAFMIDFDLGFGFLLVDRLALLIRKNDSKFYDFLIPGTMS
jgi:hypothetical protein